MRTTKLIVVLGMALALSAGCSKGTSTEQTGAVTTANTRTAGTGREAPIRSRADGIVGTYYGYIARADGSFVPANLDIEVTRSAAASASQLKASLKIGLFGGVVVGTDNVSYDMGTGLVSVYVNSNNGETLTLMGRLSQGVLVGATLTGSRSHTQNLVLSKKGTDLFADGDATYAVEFPSSGSKLRKGTLDITPKLQAQQSNGTSDLPMIPSLTANFNFQWGVSPVVVQSVIYDPLTAQMDLVLDGGNRLHFVGVALGDSSTPAFAPGSLSGMVFAGSTAAASVEALQSSASEGHAEIGSLRPVYMVGTFTGTQSDLRYRAIAALQYLGSQGHNPPEVAFPDFPNMELTVTVCVGGEGIGPMKFEAVSIDPVGSKALFQETRGAETVDYDASFTPGFGGLSGTLTSLRGSEGAAGDSSSLVLRAVSGSVPPRCANAQ